MTEYEIEYIKKESIDKLKPSTTGLNGTVHDESIRTSETAFLNVEDPIINNIMKKCISRIDEPIGHCEKLQVVPYKTGGFYLPHHDCTHTHEESKNIYDSSTSWLLNDEYEEGETSFPKLDIKFKFKKGDCLFFHNFDNYGLDTSMSLHSGEPVKSGEKWICTIWVHK